MRYAICYLSSTTKEMKLKEVKNYLVATADYNNDHDIRGLLLYVDGKYFQILEGEKQLVQGIFEDIKKDTRHKDIIQIVGKDVNHGAFDGFKAETLNEDKINDYELVKLYMEQVEGLDAKTQGVVKHMLETIIETH